MRKCVTYCNWALGDDDVDADVCDQWRQCDICHEAAYGHPCEGEKCECHEH